MKQRNSLVSNSSSSNFIIWKKDLTSSQIYMVLNWKTEGPKVGIDIKDAAADNWVVEDYGNAIGFHSAASNFNMKKYLEEIVKIDPAIMQWRGKVRK